MAVARWPIAASGQGASPRAPFPPRGRRLQALRERVARDWRGLAGLAGTVRLLAHGFGPPSAAMVAVGVAIVAWDIAVPVVGARVIDAMAAERPFEEVALLIVGLAALIWVPHGNLLPYLLDRTDISRFSVRLQGRLAVRGLRMALVNPENARRVAAGELNRGEAQPILVEGRENIGRLALRVVREIPAALRGLCVVGLLLFMAPLFVPFLLLGAAADLAITYRMGARLGPRFEARQDAENAQRRLENELLADHFGRPLRPDEVDRVLAPYEAAVRLRVESEIAAEVPALGYKLKRDLVFNLTNATAWIVGAWYVVAGESPLGSFLFFIAWSSRANELFLAVMNLQQEVMRARRSVERLAGLAGLRADGAGPGDPFGRHSRDPDRNDASC
jgi:ABC-type multidrug transport system fused ATPase/permease subunit